MPEFQTAFAALAELLRAKTPGTRDVEIVNKGAGLIIGRVVVANFDVGTATLKPEHERALEDLVAVAKSPDADLRVRRITGHASTTGPEASSAQFIGNIQLSRNRASIVLDWLKIKGGLSPTSLPTTLIANGSRHPILETGDEVEEPLNRSVELVFTLANSAQMLAPGGCRNWKIDTSASLAGGKLDIGNQVKSGGKQFTAGWSLGGSFELGTITCLDDGESRNLTLVLAEVTLGGGLNLLPEELSPEAEVFIKTIILDRLNVSASVLQPDAAGKFITKQPVDIEWFDGRVVFMVQTSAAPIVAGVEQTVLVFFDADSPLNIGPLTFLPAVTLAPFSFEVSASAMIGVIKLEDRH